MRGVTYDIISNFNHMHLLFAISQHPHPHCYCYGSDNKVFNAVKQNKYVDKAYLGYKAKCLPPARKKRDKKN